MRKFEVGKIFEEGKTQYQEGCKFDFDNSGGVLYIFFNNPTSEEITSIKSGQMKAGFFCKENIIFMLWKFENMEWMDTPFSVHLSKGLVLEKIEPNMGYGITIFLINAGNGILEALRFISVSEKFSKEFYATVQKQRIDIFDISRFDRTLSQIYQTYSTKEMAKLGVTERVGKHEI